MMKALLTLLGLIAGLTAARADERFERFERANADFEAGRFKEAAAAYEELLDQGGPRVAVLQNLGSAYFRTGEHGRAILAFERALLLQPGDPDLRANLKLARDQAAVFPPPPARAWQGFLERPSRKLWSGLALGSALLLPLAAGLWLGLRSRWRGAAWGAICASLAGLAALGLSLHALHLRQGEDARGIVVADPAKVRISPFEKAEERGRLAGGREVRLGREENGYFWVSVDGGATAGWVAAAEVERLIPAARTGD
jgi:tetratricopeptide (TPR) repeat protein